jgi:hypothetical protein
LVLIHVSAQQVAIGTENLHEMPWSKYELTQKVASSGMSKAPLSLPLLQGWWQQRISDLKHFVRQGWDRANRHANLVVGQKVLFVQQHVALSCFATLRLFINCLMSVKQTLLRRLHASVRIDTNEI